MTAKPKAVLYARFSPRPLPASCPSGHEFKADATGDTKIFAYCPVCKASVIVRNSESCESQLADLRQYCWKRGYEIISQHADKALSGADDCHNRPALFDAKVACKRGYRLIVRNLDRLFRDMDKAALFRAEMNAKGVKIMSLEQPDADTQTATGKLMAAIYDWMSEIKREEIRARTRAKMREHQRNGRVMGGGQPPFGTSLDPDNPKRLIPNAEEQSTITTIRALHRQGKGLRPIARWLEKEGIPRRGKRTWSHQLVRAILEREGLLEASASPQ